MSNLQSEHWLSIDIINLSQKHSPAFYFKGSDVFYILKLKERCEPHGSTKLFSSVSSKGAVLKVSKVAQLTVRVERTCTMPYFHKKVTDFWYVHHEHVWF